MEKTYYHISFSISTTRSRQGLLNALYRMFAVFGTVTIKEFEPLK